MKLCTVNSSDLALARALSHRLIARGGEKAEEQTRNLPESGYRRFAAARSGDSPPPPTRPASSASSMSPPLDPREIQSWDALLAWSMELCRSWAGFVVDSQGFVIASRGNVPDDGFEGTGAELCFAMEQMDKLDAEGAVLKAVELQFESHTLASIRIPEQGGIGPFILGHIGSRALMPEVRDTIIRQAKLGLEHMI